MLFFYNENLFSNILTNSQSVWCAHDKNMQTLCLCVNALLRSPSLGSKGGDGQMLPDGVGGRVDRYTFLKYGRLIQYISIYSFIIEIQFNVPIIVIISKL